MIIRLATQDDFAPLFELGRNTPELRVSDTEEFMDIDEFKWSLTQPKGAFFLAEDQGEIVGFIYGMQNDNERPYANKYACLVYLVVDARARGKGIATKLYAAFERSMRERGVENIYGWAHPASGVIEFMKKQGYAEGHPYVWMDKKI